MEIIKPKDYQIKVNDSFLFDTNIWLLLFYPIGNFEERDVKTYSIFFENVLRRNSGIFITSIILSEIANVILRYEFNIWREDNDKYDASYKKDYVGTQDYKDIVEIVNGVIEKILQLDNIIKVSDNFNGINLERVNNNFGDLDFNDSYLTELSRSNGYKIVTNDRDFLIIDEDVTIITKKILN